MDNLKKSIMGKYNAEDVDKLLLKVRKDYEEVLKEQKERIFLLREQNKQMASAINEYRENEKYIIGAITKAEETAQAIVMQAVLKAKKREAILEKNEKQIKIAIEGGYKKLYGLKAASETIFRAVSKAIGEHEKNAIQNVNNIRPIKSLY